MYITETIPPFETFYTTYYPLVRTVLSRMQGTYREDIDDLVQETFVRAWKNYERLDHSQNVAGWISRIAYHVKCSFLETMHVHRRLDSPLTQDDEQAYDIPDPSSEVRLRFVEESDAIAQAYHQLSPDNQRVMDLLWQEYKPAEIAATLHLEHNELRNRMNQARRQFQYCYAEA